MSRVTPLGTSSYLVAEHDTRRPKDDPDEGPICRSTPLHLRRIPYRHHGELCIRLPQQLARAFDRDDRGGRLGSMDRWQLPAGRRAVVLQTLTGIGSTLQGVYLAFVPRLDPVKDVVDNLVPQSLF